MGITKKRYGFLIQLAEKSADKGKIAAYYWQLSDLERRMVVKELYKMLEDRPICWHKKVRSAIYSAVC